MKEYNIDFLEGNIDLVEEAETAYKINRELNLALEIVEDTGANLFLTGRAGTGKTTFLRKLVETTSKRAVVLAPTGVAAINARGNTLHSFFQLPFAPYLPGKGFLTHDKKYLNMSRQKKQLISSLSLLIIDEISMVRPDVLDSVDAILRRVRKSNLPFGGVQLLMIGDLRQLPPVVKEDEWDLLREHYATPYFFESHALRKAGFQTVELKVVYRQSDSGFLDILNAIRDGKADLEMLERLNRRHIPSFQPDDKEGYIRLTTHNRSAAKINDARLQALPTPLHEFEAEIKGDFPEPAFPTDRRLLLKEGALVMFVKNDTGSMRRYYNGMLGIVESIGEDNISVRPLDRDEIVLVEKTEWENTRYNIDSDSNVTQETIGTFSQYPLMLAWAITIHKSQGLTFDRAIIDASHSFAPGQTYVALSRCRSLDGLVLESPVPPRAVITDGNINSFVEYCERNAPDADKISLLKKEYFVSLLRELFDFESLRISYADFYRCVMEYMVPIYPDLEYPLREHKETIEKSLCEVSRKFLSSSGALTNDDPDSDTNLSARIKKGCGYFLEIMEELHHFLHNMPRELDNSLYASRLNSTFDSLTYLVSLKGLLLTSLSKTGFSVPAFLNAKAKAVASLEGNRQKPAYRKRSVKASAKQRGVRAEEREDSKQRGERRERGERKRRGERGDSKTGNTKEENKEKQEKNPKGYSTFETLRFFREGKDLFRIAEERNLKPATIAGHIKTLIQLGKIQPEELADSTTLELICNLRASNPAISFGELLEKVNKELASPLSNDLFGILWTAVKP